MKLNLRKKFTPTRTNVEANGGDQERGQWGSQAEFILSCLGYAMGLGNVWKFPYTCFSNGGGAYLIPYVIVLTLIGIPTFFLELIMGQYSGKGPVEVWCLAPIFQGLGLAQLLISSMINIFYTMLLAYCLYYFAMCFQSQLPWDTCKNSYNTPACFNLKEAKPCHDVSGLWYNNTCYNQTEMEGDELERMQNLTKNLVPSSQEYFFFKVLEQSDGIENPMGIKMELALCLLGMWVLCFLCLIKGIESSGKVVYFTTTFPYVVLTILLIRGAMLDGSILGIKYYLIPDWKRLADAKVWGDAAGQIFFALSVGAGGLLTYSSYSPFHSNIYRTALTVAIANACTDWYAGFVVFSALGYMAKAQNTEVKNVAASGAGLAFIVYPQVLSTLPVAQLWTVLFFFMLILLGIDSLNAGVEALITSTIDKWQWLRPYKTLVVLFWCALFFLLGLTQCTRAGFYWLDLISYYSSGWTLVVIGLVEMIVFAWIYGAKKIMAHVKEMTGNKLYPHWWFCWTFISPLLLLAVLIFNLISFNPLRWNDKDPPLWVPALGWLMTISPLALIVIFAVVVVIRTYRQPNWENLSCWRRFLQLFKPNSDWMPAYKVKELQAAAQKETYRVKNTEENETEQNGNSNEGTDGAQSTATTTTTGMSDYEEVEKDGHGPPNGFTTCSVHSEDIHLENKQKEAEKPNGKASNGHVNSSSNRSIITDDDSDVTIGNGHAPMNTTYENPAFDSNSVQ